MSAGTNQLKQPFIRFGSFYFGTNTHKQPVSAVWPRRCSRWFDRLSKAGYSLPVWVTFLFSGVLK
jgi:hypothetical protein